MKRSGSPRRHRFSFSNHFLGIATVVVASLVGLTASCSKPATQPAAPAATSPAASPSRPSEIKVETREGGPLVVTTSAAEFQILPSGSIQGTLLKDGKRLTLDDPGVGSAKGSDYLIHDGQEFQFVPDFSKAAITEASGKLGRGKRVEIPGHPLASTGLGIERTLVVEAYDDFPGIVLASVAYKNTGTKDFKIDQAVEQQHHF